MLVDGLVERAGEALHSRGGLDRLSVEGDGDAPLVRIYLYSFGRDGASVYDDVLQDVARSVVDSALDLPDLGSRSVVDSVTFHLRVRVVCFFHDSPSASMGERMCV